LQNSGAFFCGRAAKKPGYPGLRYRSGPGAARRGRFAPLLSLALFFVEKPQLE
jgi:hypothetical protein